ncbi:Sec-independent protein translocase subunit TatB [Skermania sp. ID1734]|uniref:Sec-independent protein translocase protein TatB n=1 Tax=Skermania sp. ID1734 TaxID=2597516 RepID=UPI00117EBFA8|nr:Sec-independent protein translocase protein TatB [Skermania sp. ID1734]TSE01905.1 Sec-independent protein translocase subunit TatB [Skermania sp. ID1734]
MFGNIGWGEMLVLLIAALVILGPERLPGAIRWVTQALRQVRDYASGATQQLKDELGPEFEDLRQPISEISKLRGMNPRTVITKHLFDGDDSFLTSAFDGLTGEHPATNGHNGQPVTPPPAPTAQPYRNKPLKSGEVPPIDPDAT